MPAPGLLADALADRLRRLASEAPTAATPHRPLLLSASLPTPPSDPIDLFAAAGSQRFLWCRPGDGLALVGLGVAARLAGQAGRSPLADRWLGLRRRTLVDASSCSPVPAPVAVGGLAFDPLRATDPLWASLPPGLIVPRLLYTFCGGSSWLTANVVLTPGSDFAEHPLEPIAADLRRYVEAAQAGDGLATRGGRFTLHNHSGAGAWQQAVAEIARAIDRGEVQKVVLARRLHVSAPRAIDAAAVLRRLRLGYAECSLYAYAQDGACFLGASPERLVRVQGLHVACDPLAGSAARGATAHDDQLQATALLADEKERREHALVVQAIKDTLQPLVSTLDAPRQPDLVRISNVQHLHTPIRGLLTSPTNVLELVERLHPTPATGGLPKDRALALIRRYEPFSRGWYAGPIGWVDGDGNGDFAVAIRSALVQGRDAYLYAGCGIVSGSHPEREYAESWLKLRAMLWALGGDANDGYRSA